MANQQYLQHDWSPTLWAGLLGVMVLVVVGAMLVYLSLTNRAAQATTSRVDPTPVDEPTAADPVPAKPAPAHGHAPAA